MLIFSNNKKIIKILVIKKLILKRIIPIPIWIFYINKIIFPKIIRNKLKKQ